VLVNPPHSGEERFAAVFARADRPLATPAGWATHVVAAPAKINWILDVLERREDGYHELETIASTVTLADELAISNTGDGSGVTLRCSDESLPTGDANLAHRAATLLARRSGIRSGAHIRLTKRIPAGAGLGGGSSDAAAVLRVLNRLWTLNWSLPRLVPLAAAIGSDVPLLLVGGTAVARGRGEFVEPIAFSWPGWLVIAMPAVHVPTRDIYASVCRGELRGVSDAMAAFPGGDDGMRWTARDLLQRCRNTLEAAAFRRFRELAELQQELERTSGRTWRLCGSGSSMFTAWDTADEADNCVRTVRARFGIRAETARLAVECEPQASHKANDNDTVN
jgi:4-diphosphocytidyl-2-C-methyl-D-erythritol kinase